MLIYNFWISIVKDNENWLLVSKKIVWGGVSGPLGSMRKLFLARRKKKVGPRSWRSLLVRPHMLYAIYKTAPKVAIHDLKI
jgi:hypothetical protein